MKFTATEAGFKDGVGGASNSKGGGERHYVLFGLQTDPQHPKYSGIYFEYDSQRNGAVNSVNEVTLFGRSVIFRLSAGNVIEIDLDINDSELDDFKEGVYHVFTSKVVG